MGLSTEWNVSVYSEKTFFFWGGRGGRRPPNEEPQKNNGALSTAACVRLYDRPTDRPTGLFFSDAKPYWDRRV